MLEVVADDTPDGQDDAGVSVLPARRHRYTGTVSFFRCWSPTPAPLARLVWVVCRRWRIEEESAWRRRHQHRARQAHRRWHAYADTTP
ncbi:hypothetical protein AB0D10_40850 [Kitasatospora sp. NPDC048545]|uniref:hypothetical protein n=1 Tax=Kitasatospora sp. NPDC048545 TaxID=3157208 RepID=UPI0033C30F1D